MKHNEETNIRLMRHEVLCEQKCMKIKKKRNPFIVYITING